MPYNFTDAQFRQRKVALLTGLQSNARDASPKGSIDEEILPLVIQLNKYDGVVTTSSCAGRMVCYLEGAKVLTHSSTSSSLDTSTDQASLGGKGGGRWLYVSHKPYSMNNDSGSSMNLFDDIKYMEPDPKAVMPSGLNIASSSTRFVRLKFESMVSYGL